MLDSQALEKCCLTSGISVKDENCVPRESFQDSDMIGAQFSSQHTDLFFKARLVQCQNIKITFDHENGVVRNSQLLQAEENPAFIEDEGVGGVYIFCLRRTIDSSPTESYSRTSLIGKGENDSPHEWAGYPLFLLF